EMQERACLEDLTTAGTTDSGHTDQSDWSGLTPRAQRNPSGVPGLQIDGYFPDTSKTNGTHGWNHDAQFVIRLPDNWNGKLVITGAPGVRKQYSPDPVIGDWVLAKGYAYASTDKGNTGTSFYSDGQTPGDAIAEWHQRVTELAIATKQVVVQKYGRPAARTYVTGISNGGYLTRWQLENRPDLYDGGVDWEGTLMSAEGPNLFTYLPVALRNFPRYRATGDRAAHDAMIAAGFSPGSEFLWEDHYAVYWDLTQRVYREELDPDYDGGLSAGIPFCQPGTPMCDADYDYAARGEGVRAAIRKAENTGDIGKPMLTLHGTIDALLPIATDSDVYRRMVLARGKGARHRYYVIENGTHVDGRYDLFPDRVRPIWPCWGTALDALDAWVDRGVEPPPDQFVPDRRGPGADPANECALA
ncbi:MAG: tannase/feruloyl esterase family alpha/beta hydrolase, partial [Actinomycetes bacterium]